MQARLLLALDVDGTLLRADGTVSSEDRRAIARARSEGIEVTLATGRLTTATLPLARQLGLEAPLVCADGAVVFCPRRDRALTTFALTARAVGRLLAHARARGIAPFVFTHGAAHGAPPDLDRYSYIDGWTSEVVRRDDLPAAVEIGALCVVTAIGIGAEPVVRAAEAALLDEQIEGAAIDVFRLGRSDDWVLRMAAAGCSKAAGLAEVASYLGLTAAHTVAIGDWYNDVPMLLWAERSFAMGQAPEDVRRAAKHQLRATVASGGAVAEALAILLDGQ